MTAQSRSSRETDRLIQRNRTFSKPPWRAALIAGGFSPIPNTAELLRQQITDNRPVHPGTFDGSPAPNFSQNGGLIPMRAGGRGWYAYAYQGNAGVPSAPIMPPVLFDVRSFDPTEGDPASQLWTVTNGVIGSDGRVTLGNGEIFQMQWNDVLPNRPAAALERMALSVGITVHTAPSGAGSFKTELRLSDGANADLIEAELIPGDPGPRMTINGVIVDTFVAKAPYMEWQGEILNAAVGSGLATFSSRTDDAQEIFPGQPPVASASSSLFVFAVGPIDFTLHHVSGGRVEYQDY